MTNKIGVSPKYRHNRVGAVGEEGVEDQDDTAPETGPPGEPSISSDPQENAPLKVARDPGDPTKKEREDHNATHIPFRSWCPICVRAREREEAHRNGRRKERSCKATTLFDCKTCGEEDDRDDKATAIVYKDDHTKMILGHVCERKGASDTWVIEKIKEDIARLRYQDVILKGDGEPPSVQVRRPASDRWNVDAVKAMQASPRVPNPEHLRQAKVMPSDEEN